MQRKIILNIGLSALTTIIALTNSISPTFSQTTVENTPDTSTQEKAENSQSDTVTFLCKEIFDKKMFQVPQKLKSPLIRGT